MKTKEQVEMQLKFIEQDLEKCRINIRKAFEEKEFQTLKALRSMESRLISMKKATAWVLE